MLVEGAVDVHPFIGLAVVLAAALNGIAVLQAYFRVFTGKRYFPSISLQTRSGERVAMLTLALLILAGGLFPEPGLLSRHHAASEIIQSREHLTEAVHDSGGRFWFGEAPLAEVAAPFEAPPVTGATPPTPALSPSP